MRLRLRPQDEGFYELFTASAENLVEGVRLLAGTLEGEAERPAIAIKLRDVEHRTDEVTHGIIRRVNSTFVTPFDREDIYRLAATLDEVMDQVEAAGDVMVLYGVRELPTEVAEQIDVLQRAAELTAEAMPRLRTPGDLRDYWVEINRLENQADQTYRKILTRLFSGEYDALTVLKLKGVVDCLEAAADAFEHVANTVESIALKES